MIKLLLAVFMVLMMASPVWAACTGSSPTWTCTADSTSAQVNACIASATSGDTINFGAGSGTWTTQVLITKGLKLIGAGDGVTYGTGTVITSSYSGTDYESINGYGIRISPTLAEKDVGVRVSGFEINFSGNYGIAPYNTLSTPYNNPITKIRIDHNILKRGKSEVMVIIGVVHGVADNNTIDLTNGGSVDGIDEFGNTTGGDKGLNNWRYLSYSFGSSENWYYEDNAIIGPSAYYGDFIDCSWGGRYVARYNTVVHNATDYDCTPVFNMHGNDNSIYSCMGAEVYRNTVTVGRAGSYFFSQRGGKAVVFDNVLDTGSQAKIGDYGNFNASPEGCDTNVAVPIGLVDGQHQYPDTSYYFNNTSGGSQLTTIIDYGRNRYDGSDCAANAGIPSTYDIPQVNTQYWLYSAATGSPQTVGVRRGTKATMTAISTCTEGVGFWVTDEGSWNQSGSGDQGQLYRCGASNNWTLYYTPYTYPHPLRGEGTTPPSAQGCTISGSTYK